MAGAGAAAGLLAGCGSRRDPYLAEKPPVPVAAGVRAGSEKFVLSTCGLCRAGCSIRVRVVEGRAVKIEGNPDSPINRGGLCARGAAALEFLYHPGRIRNPMRRVGARGENRWRTLAWDEALAYLASELGKLRQAGEPQSLVLLDGEYQGTTHWLWRRFMEVFGSPNHIGHGATGCGAQIEVVREMTGRAGMPGCDFEGSNCVLLVGAGPLESSPQWIHLARALAGDGRSRLLCASPRLPPAAVLVEAWIPLIPGSEAALLLGLAHVLLRDGLADEAAVEKARGYASWQAADGSLRPGLRAEIVDDYTPIQVEALTSVPRWRVESLARDLASARPSAVVVDAWSNDRASAGAALVLNALLSSLGEPGGISLAPGTLLSGIEDPDLDPIAQTGLGAGCIDGRAAGESGFAGSRMLALPEALLSGKPYPAKALLLNYSNPIYSKPDGRRWAQALSRVPLVVSFSPVLDESVLCADLVLPDHTFLERWDVVAPEGGTWTLSMREPAVLPIADSMQTGEVILRLARAMGGTLAEQFPWQNYRETVLANLVGLHEDGAEKVLAKLESTGCWSASETAAAKTASGAPEKPVFLDVTNIQTQPASQDSQEVGDEERYPFVLLPVRGAGYAEGGTRELPWLGELPLDGGESGAEYVEMAVEDATMLGIEDGDRVGVESPLAKLVLRAQVHASIKPGVLGLRLGGGAQADRSARPCAAWLLAGVAEKSTGEWFACATRARVEKVA